MLQSLEFPPCAVSEQSFQAYSWLKLVRAFYYVTQLNQKGPAGCFFLTGELLTECQGAVWVSRNGGFPDLCLCICVNAPCGPRTDGRDRPASACRVLG